mmetsp:Transcript_55876/g.120866  ORF Transcript_55876/g.120866 Transcript_55876/m.120866 type:complete len:773 (+) Transcript_55876:40-2358(+)
MAVREGSPQRTSPAPRVIGVADVVKALELGALRFGGVQRSCDTLRKWAKAGRVTPGGQTLTVEAVDEGIKKWLAEKAAAPPGPEPAAALTKPKPRLSSELSATCPGSEETSSEPTAKKQRLSQESKEQRRQSEAKCKELASKRLDEVLLEIDGHMEDVLREAGPGSLEAWRSAPPEVDRRALYLQLVHAVPAPDVRAPETLCAELLAHQVEGLEWLASLHINKLHGILADEMGLGKTIQTLALILHLEAAHSNLGPHLIVAPKSTLSHWGTEFGRFAPSYRVHILTGGPEERTAILEALESDIKEGSGTALVTNYEQVYRNDALTQRDWKLVVVDEGHRLKNTETVLHNTMAKLRCQMRLLLTGTPLQNSLNELWALLHYLLPNIFTHMMDFRTWFTRPFRGIPGLNEFEVQLDPEQEHKVIERMHALLSPFLLQRLKADALADQLPPKTESIVRVKLSSWQKSVYDDLQKRTIRLLSGDASVSSEQVNNALMQMRKIVLHPYLFQSQYAQDKDIYRASGKVEALDRILPKLVRFGHKVLIFSQFTSMLDILEAYLSWKDISSVRLDGSVSHLERGDRIQRFNEDQSIHVFLLSARAGCLGLNLQSADTVILFDMDWNPQNDKQAVARAHRVGQKREVRVIRLVTDSGVERHMEQRCLEKLEMEKKIMGAGMFRRQATTQQRSDALRSILGLEAKDGSPDGPQPEADAGLTAPEELNELLARGAEELAAFQSIDAELLRPLSRRDNEDLLVQCGRLMSQAEVPAGFTVDEEA